MADRRQKLVAIGDFGCGKTSLLCVFATGEPPNEFVSPVFQSYVADVELDGRRRVEIALWDTVDLEDYDRLRPLSYSNSHVILICYAIDTPESLKSVMERWIVEARYFSPEAPVLLVGCKKDLRYNHSVIEWLARENQSPLSYEQGQAVASNIGARSFHECSALTREGVQEVFKYAARAALSKRMPARVIGNREPLTISRIRVVDDCMAERRRRSCVL